MNKITIIMLALTLVGCKTRSYEKTRVTKESSESSQLKKDSTGSSTLKVVGSSVTTKASVTTSKDSSDSRTTFTPVPGTRTIIHPDGTIEGEFSNIDNHSKKSTSSSKRDTSTRHKSVNSAATSDSHLKSDENHQAAMKQDSTFKKGTSDSTLANNVPTWVWILAVILVLGVVVYIIIRVKAAKSLL